MTSTLWTIAAAAACTLFLPTVSFAYDFRPTPSEWAMWPDFCKARYVTTTAGNTSPYAATVPPAMIENWRARLGDATFDAVHHYCAGVAYTQRAAVARSAQQRTYLLNVAESECKYSFERTPVSSPLYREIARNLQLVRAMRGVTPPVPH